MKLDWAFLRLVFIFYGGLTVLALWLLFELGGGEHDRTVLAGAMVSIVNFLLGFASVEYAFEKSHTTFLKIVLGGMVGRLLAMTGVVLVLIKVYGYDALALMLSLVGYYIVNLAFEIMFLQKKVTLKSNR
ncbi:MAG: hypothetical protein HYW57_04790 [Ignavibacteriales bacterium]|nr:hypothetical protein [Ignavibacteriales bacterium]